MKKWFCSVLVFCFTVFLSHAQIVFKATVDNNQVGLGDNFQITFELDNADGNKFQPPAFDNFAVIEGPSQSTSVEFNNGKVNKSVSYTYVLQPKSTGTFIIGPANIEVNGNTLQSNSVKIVVVKSSSSSANNGKGNSVAPATPDLSKKIFMVASVDKSSVFEGEQVTLTYKLYYKVNVLQAGIDETPPYNGFWAEDINVNRQQPKTEVYNGQEYETQIIKETALFPNELGKLSVDQLKLKTIVQVEVKSKSSNNQFPGFPNDPFFNPFTQVQNVPYTALSNAVTVDVKPLPDAGKPADFTGAVGRFSLESRIDTGSLKTGEPIPMSITISGEGNLKLIDAPKLQLPPDFDSYAPKTNDNINTKSPVISGSKTIDYLFTLRNPGHYEIQPVNFSYFNPDTKQYVMLHTPSYSLTVRKGNGAPVMITSGLSKQDIKLLNQDIRYIKENTTLLITGRPFTGSALFYGLIVFPVMAFGGAFFFLNRERKLRSDVVGTKARLARKLAVKKLALAKQFMQNHDRKGFYNEVSRAIWGYIGDKMALPASELSRDNLVAYLNEKQVSEHTVNELFDVIDHCELALYAPSAAGNVMQQDYEKTADLISKLEQEISSKDETTA